MSNAVTRKEETRNEKQVPGKMSESKVKKKFDNQVIMYRLLRSIERFHNAVEIEIFGSFIDTNLPPCPKNFSGANDVISTNHALLAGIVFHVLPRVCPHWYNFASPWL